MASHQAGAQEKVTSAAVWHPDAGFMQRFQSRCDGRRGTAFDDCFADAMANSDASKAALDFTRRLDNQAYLQALEPTGGPVAVAHVFTRSAPTRTMHGFSLTGCRR